MKNEILPDALFRHNYLSWNIIMCRRLHSSGM